MTPELTRRAVRVLHVATVPGSLGFLRGQAAFMRDRGIELFAASSDGPERRRFSETECVPVEVIEMPRRISPVRDLLAVRALARFIRKLRPDIVHAHTPKGGLLGMLAATVAGVPRRVYHMRGLPYETATGAKRTLLRTTERVSCALADVVVCVSESLRDVAIRDGLAPAGKLRVLAHGSGNGVDAVRRFNPKTAQALRSAERFAWGIDDDAFHVVFIGRIVRDKGILDLAAAWPTVRARWPNARLSIVGDLEVRDAVPDGALQSLIADTSITVRPAEPDPVALFAAADVIALPSHREGFPNVLLEAAAMERPVVATRVTGCVDAVIDGVTGTLVRPLDPAALADALLAYAGSVGLRHRHGRAARERVLREFLPERIWDELASVYQSLLTR